MQLFFFAPSLQCLQIFYHHVVYLHISFHFQFALHAPWTLFNTEELNEAEQISKTIHLFTPMHASISSVTWCMCVYNVAYCREN